MILIVNIELEELIFIRGIIIVNLVLVRATTITTPLSIIFEGCERKNTKYIYE